MAPQLTEDEIDDLIYLARVGEDGELAEMLTALSEREKVTPAEILVAAKDDRKSTALHMACGNGHLETVRKLVQYFDARPSEEKQAFLDEPNEHGNTGMHWAALGGHLAVVKLLDVQQASPALANESNYVPLDLANFNNHNDVANYFLAAAGMLEGENADKGGLDGGVEGVGLAEEEGAEGDGQGEEKVEGKEKAEGAS